MLWWSVLIPEKTREPDCIILRKVDNKNQDFVFSSKIGLLRANVKQRHKNKYYMWKP